MKTYFKTVAFWSATFLICLLTALPAQAQVPAGLEGPIDAVAPATNRMRVMGILVLVPPGTPINSPTASLTLADVGGAPLPGRTTPGFIGGTAIVNGTANPDGSVTATDVFVEPMEGVMIGRITSSTCTNAGCSGGGSAIRVMGRSIGRITDPRMLAEPVKNDFGFELNLTGANLAGRPVALEGYYAGGRFFYFLMEITGVPGLLARPTTREVSIQRAQCREDVDGIQLNVLGAVHNPRTGLVTLDAVTASGTTNAVIADAKFGTYTFRQTFPGVTTCPASITATFGVATATADLDIIAP